MGGAINKDLYVDVEGKRIYVCCKGCIKSVKQDPAKYIKALEDQGVTVASLQTKCPVMGGAVNKKLYADVEGKRVYVCCRGCIGAIKSDPDKWLKKLADENVIVEDVPGKEDK
jgi:YHS domain-containing protein